MLFFGIKSHVALDRNPEQEYNTLLLRLIPGDLLSACPHRQFLTLHTCIDLIFVMTEIVFVHEKHVHSHSFCAAQNVSQKPHPWSTHISHKCYFRQLYFDTYPSCKNVDIKENKHMFYQTLSHNKAILLSEYTANPQCIFTYCTFHLRVMHFCGSKLLASNCMYVLIAKLFSLLL